MEELTLRDASDFRDELEDFLKNKFKEAVVLTVIGLSRSSKYLQCG